MANKSSSDVLSLKHIGDIQGGQLVYKAGAQHRDFWAVVLLETENGTVGRDQAGGRKEEVEGATLAGHH